MIRLIDAGLLLDHLSGRLESMKDYDAIKNVVNNMPTAYDQDKVIELIETKILGKVCIGCGYLKNNICTYKGSNCGVSKPIYEDIKKVFEEVKGGGSNE